ncbi:MAG: DUF1385 domain-containing protein [Candidatus Cloacimonadota bacterium]|nr:MAG: DUF1385 domain-containing protein [Candidatus Cloacimonadota bacterium]
MNERPELAVGGQAVIEGVMMRGPENIATAIRRANGEILVKKEKFISLTKRKRIFGLPIIRGFVSLIEMMIIGFKSLNFSAEQAMEHEKSNDDNVKKNSKLWSTLTYMFAFGLAFLIFVYLPYKSAYWLKLGEKTFSFNIIAGIFRIVVFVAYIWVISLFKEVRRIFEFHGAEHKSVFAYEHQENLNFEHTLKYGTKHPRCGTSFIFIVLVIAILIFSILDSIVSVLWKIPPLPLRILIHLLFLPLISGISYEVLKFSGKNINHPLVKIFTFPGLLLQYITTKEPDEKQIEVAIIALKTALNLPIPDKHFTLIEDTDS